MKLFIVTLVMWSLLAGLSKAKGRNEISRSHESGSHESGSHESGSHESGSHEHDDEDDATRLTRYIRSKFDVVTRVVVPPAKTTNGTTTINFGLGLVNIMKINEDNGQFTGIFWNRYLWTDGRLKWNPANYGGKTNIRIPSSWIWKPDIKLYNSLDVGSTEDQDALVVVANTGDVLWIPPAIYNVFCNRTDRGNHGWKCSMKFGSWTYDGFTLDLAMYDGLAEMDLSDYRAREWNVVKNKLTRNVRHYECCKEPYIDMTYEFELNRK